MDLETEAPRVGNRSDLLDLCDTFIELVKKGYGQKRLAYSVVIHKNAMGGVFTVMPQNKILPKDPMPHNKKSYHN